MDENKLPEQNNAVMNRDYSTISPSARALLLLKGLTNIPYAREAAELLIYPAAYDPMGVTTQEAAFWARVIHFENRYWSIDQLCRGTGITNFLELSSGFSFRGLEMVKENNIHYIDTDLPEIIDLKKGFIETLQKPPVKGLLETLALNALDKERFEQLLGHFPRGPVIILNEGLLMYLGLEEKKKLCNIIHHILEKRSGYWITADVYIKKPNGDTSFSMFGKENDFFKQHNIEENKFESFEHARTFFEEAGFIIDKEAERDPGKLSSLKHLTATGNFGEFNQTRKWGRIRTTWKLKVKN